MKTAVVLIAMACIACGSEPPPTAGGGAPLFPLAVGNEWFYRVSTNNGEKEKRNAIVESTGESTYTFVTESDEDITTSTQVLEGTRLVRTIEESSEHGTIKERLRFAPSSLRVDVDETRLGQTYSTDFQEEHLDSAGAVVSSRAKSQRFVIESVDDEITVPAGTFRSVRVRRDTVGGPSKTYWYVRGIGKIREVGGQTEELSRYTIEETP